MARNKKKKPLSIAGMERLDAQVQSCLTVSMQQAAAAMWGTETYREVPEELRNRLDEVDLLIHRTGGGLGSRQILAVVIAEYQREKAKEEKANQQFLEFIKAESARVRVL